MNDAVRLQNVIGLAALALTCLTTPAQAKPCQISKSGALELSGPTNKAMLDCIEAMDRKSLRTLIVKSPGGPVGPAMRIANLLASFRPEVVIKGNCDSSCANYLLPIASHIFLGKRARILIHGGVDEGLAAFQLAQGRTLPPNAAADIEAQRAFVARQRISPGWLLARSMEDYKTGNLGQHVEGAVMLPEGVSDEKVRYILVDEPFLKSCLPAVKVTFEGETLASAARSDEKLRHSLASKGYFLSGSLKCKAVSTK